MVALRNKIFSGSHIAGYHNIMLGYCVSNSVYIASRFPGSNIHVVPLNRSVETDPLARIQI